MLFNHLNVFFVEMSVYISLPVSDKVVCFVDIEQHELFVLEINPLLVSLFANIFSHSVGFLFFLFLVSCLCFLLRVL